MELVLGAVWASLIVQLVKNLPAVPETPVDSWFGKIHWRRDRLPTPVFLGFSRGSDGNESMTETWVLSLGQEDLLEMGTSTHSSIVTWRIPWTEEPGGL